MKPRNAIDSLEHDGRGSELRRLNFDLAGELPEIAMSTPTNSISLGKNWAFFNFQVR